MEIGFLETASATTSMACLAEGQQTMGSSTRERGVATGFAAKAEGAEKT